MNVLYRKFSALLFLAAAAAGLQGQEKPSDLKERYVILNITTRVEENQQELWNETNSKITLLGRPVNLKLVAGNVVIDIQLTPYLRGRQNLLIAQGQILFKALNEGVSYKSTVQTIPLDFGEEIIFFPLGSDVSANPRIEMKIVMRRYEDAVKEAEPAEAENPAGG